MSDREAIARALAERLTAGVPEEERNSVEQARWLLANLLDWHRREEKATWWEYFRLKALSADELLDERAALSRLTFVGDVTGLNDRTPVHRYSFPEQDTEIRPGDKISRHLAGASSGR